MVKGDISNQTVPVVLFHYGELFVEVGIWPLKRLDWKKHLPPEFHYFMLRMMDNDVSVGVLVPKKYEHQLERVMDWVPFRRVFTYQDIQDINEIAVSRWNGIAEYYDTDPERGHLFGLDRWRNSGRDSNSDQDSGG